MTATILVLNAGSSSLKFALYPVAEGAAPLLRGRIAGIGRAPAFSATDATGRNLAGPPLDPAALPDEITASLLDWIAAQPGGLTLAAAGHRIVHGGRDFDAPVVVTGPILTRLDALVPLAPLHQPHNLAALRATAARAPGIPQIACFDTAFHRTMPRLAQIFALPRDLTEAGILRYGFHGLSYDYIAGVLPLHLGDRAEGRVIVAHLGNGASLCALLGRRSRATSMGFTALDGLMMGQRSGALDPGVILHLMEEKGLSAAEVSDLLYKRSGLLGVSGISNAMQVLEASGAPEAAEAIALFCARAASGIAALIPALGGLDALVFTAGIGENSAAARARICDGLGWLGLSLDPEANARGTGRISGAASAIAVHVIPTDEELVIARAARRALLAPHG